MGQKIKITIELPTDAKISLKDLIENSGYDGGEVEEIEVDWDKETKKWQK